MFSDRVLSSFGAIIYLRRDSWSEVFSCRILKMVRASLLLSEMAFYFEDSNEVICYLVSSSIL